MPGRSCVANPNHGTCNVQLRRPAPTLTAPRYQGWAAEGSETGAPRPAPSGRTQRSWEADVRSGLAAGRLRRRCCCLRSRPQARVPAPRIKVLSNRADLVSGGDALVRVKLPRGVPRLAPPADGGAPQRHARAPPHRPAAPGRPRAPACGSGRVPLTARIRGGGAARLFVTNHPIGGPVFAGPQIQPWTCQAGARDAKCNQTRLLQVPLPARRARPRNGAALPGHELERQQRLVPAVRPEEPAAAPTRSTRRRRPRA